jgi:serine/threonine protein kinase
MVNPASTPTADEAPLCAECGAPLSDGHCLRCLLSLGEDSSEEEPAAVDSMAGRVFGDFELQEEIARGGMGVVYRAQQRSLQREVALKLMLGGELADAVARRMFQTEALAVAALHHPNIVAVHDAGECDLQPYIAMHFVAGRRNVAHWAAERRKSGAWREIAAALALVARAVAHAHERGVLHRDLKPSNVLWEEGTGPQVTDFGLAKIIGSSGDGVTLSVRMLGSPGYMAPEQVVAETARKSRRPRTCMASGRCSTNCCPGCRRFRGNRP